MRISDFYEALVEFDVYLRVEKNLSERTRKAYQYDLKRFGDFLASAHKRVPALDKIAAEDIRVYLQNLQMERSCKASTLSRVLSSLRVFFEYCVRAEFLLASPASHFQNPKKPRNLPVFLVEAELKKLFDAPDLEQWRGARDFAFLVTFAFTGLRLQELIGLNIDDIDFGRKTLRVLGKGAKERIVPMNRRVLDALSDYLAQRPYANTAAVFLNYKLQRISPRGIQKLVRQYAILAGVGSRKISPHKLRHTFATLLHYNGVGVLDIQSLLGHASVTSTQIYTHTSSDRLTSAVETLENTVG
ncbi:MAG: Tyrosine recombinase XerD [candidate division BRC1 bacterium ADurb.BinA364]|nr:MAG: Tyrosine recombinase XerD [candidate division BRC1 bacterium ADurb.BinA364]